MRGLRRGYMIFQFSNLVKAVSSAFCNVCITTGILLRYWLRCIMWICTYAYMCKMLHDVNINFSVLVQCACREPSNGGGQWYSNIQYLCAMTQQHREFFIARKTGIVTSSQVESLTEESQTTCILISFKARVPSVMNWWKEVIFHKWWRVHCAVCCGRPFIHIVHRSYTLPPL